MANPLPSSCKQNVNAKGLRGGADGRIYAIEPTGRRIVSWGPDGTEKIVAANVDAFDLALTSSGSIYYTDPVHKTVVTIDAKGQRRNQSIQAEQHRSPPCRFLASLRP